MRAFISISIPKNIRKEIRKIQENLPEFFGKKIELENLHLTLKFLGDIGENKLEGVKEKLREIKFNQFKTEIDSIGVFSEKFIRIVWLHLTNCNDLQKEIDERLEDLFEKENRFMSHLTIARVKNVGNRGEFLENLRKIKIPKIKFVVGDFKLKKSVLTENGPIYETLKFFNLEN
ncbi:RNA 2',3'-cyclic phosphodiesterase [subsurface metagenome]